jgi:hypothetical protein
VGGLNSSPHLLKNIFEAFLKLMEKKLKTAWKKPRRELKVSGTQSGFANHLVTAMLLKMCIKILG